jgi:hypothetical protein
MIRSVELSKPAALIALTSVRTLAVTSGVEITSNEV